MGNAVLQHQEPHTVYLDANATTPLLAEVFNAMMPWYFSRAGNASSSHRRGRESRIAIETARQHVADLFCCSETEIVFTSGGTESNNLAVFGAVAKPGAHIVTSSIEHHAVLHAVERLERRGCTATYLPVDEGGQVNPDDVRMALQPNTRLVSIMMANNETGVLQPVEEIGRIAREADVLFHTDAVQAAGKAPIDVTRVGCDLLSISGHKMHGPQGTGALFVRQGVEIEAMLYGGAHEAGLRAGTESVAALVGLGQAAAIAKAGFNDRSLERVGKLRDELEKGLLREANDAGINGRKAARIPNTSNMWFGGIDGPELLRALDEMGVAASGGSACNAGACTPSHVLLAMGLSIKQASSSVRFSLSKQTTGEDVDFAIWQVSEALDRLRAASHAGR